MDAIDLTPLSTPLTSADRRAYRQQTRGVKGRAVELFGQLTTIAFCIFISVGLYVNAFGGGVRDGESYGGVTFVIASIILLVGAVLVYRLLAQRRDMIRFVKFATQNGLRVDFGADPSGEQGLIFSRGHARRILSRLTMRNGFQIANYRYVVGYGRNRKIHEWCYARIPLPRSVPNMVLDSKKNNGVWRAQLNVPFTADQKLSLEGNFDQYFTLYVPKKYERDAFYIFTPDVMQVLINHGTNFDMEIIDHSLYLYRFGRFSLGRAEQYEHLLPILDVISKKVLHQADYYADEKIDDRDVDVVAAAGARLRRHRFGIVTTIATAVFVLLYVAYVIAQLHE